MDAAVDIDRCQCCSSVKPYVANVTFGVFPTRGWKSIETSSKSSIYEDLTIPRQPPASRPTGVRKRVLLAADLHRSRSRDPTLGSTMHMSRLTGCGDLANSGSLIQLPLLYSTIYRIQPDGNTCPWNTPFVPVKRGNASIGRISNHETRTDCIRRMHGPRGLCHTKGQSDLRLLCCCSSVRDEAAEGSQHDSLRAEETCVTDNSGNARQCCMGGEANPRHN